MFLTELEFRFFFFYAIHNVVGRTGDLLNSIPFFLILKNRFDKTMLNGAAVKRYFKICGKITHRIFKDA